MTPDEETPPEDATATSSKLAPPAAAEKAAAAAPKEAPQAAAKNPLGNADEIGAERRTEARRGLHTRVSLGAPGRAPVDVRSIDISMGGMAVAADTNPGAGAPLSLSFKLMFADGSSYQVQTAGIVAYSVFSSAHRGFKIGVRFKNITPPFQAALERFLKT